MTDYDDLPDEYYDDKFERQRHRREMNSELGNPEYELDEELSDD
jgi:hypothetical protein